MNNFDDIFQKTSADTKTFAKQPFHAEGFSARRKQERDALYELANQTLSRISAGGKPFQEYLNVQSRFDRYSVTNAALVLAQMPQATRLMDFDGWKAAGGRIQRGATAITILEPSKEFSREDGSTGVFYNPKKLFDVSQTDQCPAPAVQHSHRVLLQALIDHAPCHFSVSDNLPAERSAMYDTASNTVLVRSGLAGDTCFSAVAQELACALLTRSSMNFAAPDFTAHCVSYMVSNRAGIDTSHFIFDTLPAALQDMPPQKLRDELGKMRTISSDLIATMTRALSQQERNQKQQREKVR